MKNSISLLLVALVISFGTHANAAYLLCSSDQRDSYWNPVLRASLTDSKDHFTIVKDDRLYAALDCVSNSAGSLQCKGRGIIVTITRLDTHGRWKAELFNQLSASGSEATPLACHEIEF